MNILTIPGSWPNSEDLLMGNYIKDSVEMLCAHDKSLLNYVIYCGSTEYGVSFSRPIEFISNLCKVFRHRSYKETDNLRVMINPTLYIYKFGFEYNIHRKAKVIAKELIKQNISLVHAHFSHNAGFVAYEICQKFNLPYIITEHAGPFPFGKHLQVDNLLCASYMKVLENASCIIAVSRALKNKIESYGLNNVVYIPNAINEQVFFPTEVKGNDIFRFVAISSLIYAKGIDVLLKAYAKFLYEKVTKRDHFILTICGDGSNKNDFIALARKLKIQDSVEFVDFMKQNDLNVLLGNSHCLLHASRHESFGLVCAEAQAAGIPVVVTKCGGPESIVTDPYLGELVRVDDPEEFATAMHRVFTKYHEYNPQKIRKHFLDNFASKLVCALINGEYIKYAKQ